MLESLGISYELFNYLLLPLMIFCARVVDVTLSTIKILFVMNGKRDIAPLLGFFEALIWLVAIGQIISNVDNVWSYLAYAGGFATGTWVGMFFEEKLAVGRVVLRLIVNDSIDDLRDFLHEHDFRYSILDGEGRMGKVSIVFLVVDRDKLPQLIAGVNEHHPNAFYTIEGVRKVSKTANIPPSMGRTRFYHGWRSKKV